MATEKMANVICDCCKKARGFVPVTNLQTFVEVVSVIHGDVSDACVESSDRESGPWMSVVPGMTKYHNEWTAAD